MSLVLNKNKFNCTNYILQLSQLHTVISIYRPRLLSILITVCTATATTIIFIIIHILNVVKIWVKINVECKQTIERGSLDCNRLFYYYVISRDCVSVCLSGGPGEEFDDVEDKDTYRSMLRRDERRFKTADRDGNGIATRDEFTAFLHPEDYDHMKNVVVQVTSLIVPFNSKLDVKAVHAQTHLHCTAV